jgi:hypothetical protein
MESYLCLSAARCASRTHKKKKNTDLKRSKDKQHKKSEEEGRCATEKQNGGHTYQQAAMHSPASPIRNEMRLQEAGNPKRRTTTDAEANGKRTAAQIEVFSQCASASKEDDQFRNRQQKNFQPTKRRQVRNGKTAGQ